MLKQRKLDQLQIRISTREKAELQRRAKAAGVSVSSWVLARALPPKAELFGRIVQQLSSHAEPSYALADLNDFLAALTADEFHSALEQEPRLKLSALAKTYLAAMVEHTANRTRVAVPRWVRDTPALQQPYFASELAGLRLHLLVSSPPAFRRRNLLVDASVGERV